MRWFVIAWIAACGRIGFDRPASSGVGDSSTGSPTDTPGGDGPTGAGCSTDGECVTGHCVANTCCFDACLAPGDCYAPAASCPGGTQCAFQALAPGAACSNDLRECTTDACDGAGACVHSPMADLTSCSAGQCLAGCCATAGSTGCVEFLTTGQFTVPSSITTVRVRAWGGGGGGGGRDSVDGGNGGGGGYVSAQLAVTANQMYDVVIGEGGTSGACGRAGGVGGYAGGIGALTMQNGGVGQGTVMGGAGGARADQGGDGGNGSYGGGGGGGADVKHGGGGAAATVLRRVTDQIVAGGGGGGGAAEKSRGGHGGAGCALNGEAAPDMTGHDTGGGGGGGACFSSAAAVSPLTLDGSGTQPGSPQGAAGAGRGGDGSLTCTTSNGVRGKLVIDY